MKKDKDKEEKQGMDRTELLKLVKEQVGNALRLLEEGKATSAALRLLELSWSINDMLKEKENEA